MSDKPKTKNLSSAPTLKAPEARYFLPGPIHDGLQMMVHGVEQELGSMLQRGYDVEYQLQKLLASVTLISRLDAMRLLNISEAQFDRKAASGEIEVTYIDARPRVRLTELQRFIAVNTKSAAAPLLAPTPSVVTKPARRRRRQPSE